MQLYSQDPCYSLHKEPLFPKDSFETLPTTRNYRNTIEIIKTGNFQTRTLIYELLNVVIRGTFELC